MVPGSIVISTAGRDKGKTYLVIDYMDGRVCLSDGKSKGRGAGKVKLKRVRHIRTIGEISDKEEEMIRLKAASSIEEKNIIIRRLLSEEKVLQNKER